VAILLSEESAMLAQVGLRTGARVGGEGATSGDRTMWSSQTITTT